MSPLKTEKVIDVGGQATDETVVDPSKYVLEEALYTTADGGIVREGDPAAAFVYKGVGQTIPIGEAETLGLVGGKEEPVSETKEVAPTAAEKKAPKPADKKAPAPKNKGA